MTVRLGDVAFRLEVLEMLETALVAQRPPYSCRDAPLLRSHDTVVVLSPKVVETFISQNTELRLSPRAGLRATLTRFAASGFISVRSRSLPSVCTMERV